MILLATTSTILKPNAIARHVANRITVSLNARGISLVTHPYII